MPGKPNRAIPPLNRTTIEPFLPEYDHDPDPRDHACAWNTATRRTARNAHARSRLSISVYHTKSRNSAKDAGLMGDLATPEVSLSSVPIL